MGGELAEVEWGTPHPEGPISASSSPAATLPEMLSSSRTRDDAEAPPPSDPALSCLDPEACIRERALPQRPGLRPA